MSRTLVECRDELVVIFQAWFDGKPTAPADIQPLLTWNLRGSPAINVAMPRGYPKEDFGGGRWLFVDIICSATWDRVNSGELSAENAVVNLMGELLNWYNDCGKSQHLGYWESIKWGKVGWMQSPNQNMNRKILRIELKIDLY